MVLSGLIERWVMEKWGFEVWWILHLEFGICQLCGQDGGEVQVMEYGYFDHEKSNLTWFEIIETQFGWPSFLEGGGSNVLAKSRWL